MLITVNSKEDNLLNGIIKKNGETIQVLKAREELQELYNELAIKDKELSKIAIAEECSDVLIMILQLIKIFDIDNEVDIITQLKFRKLSELLCKHNNICEECQLMGLNTDWDCEGNLVNFCEDCKYNGNDKM